MKKQAAFIFVPLFFLFNPSFWFGQHFETPRVADTRSFDQSVTDSVDSSTDMNDEDDDTDEGTSKTGSDSESTTTAETSEPNEYAPSDSSEGVLQDVPVASTSAINVLPPIDALPPPALLPAPGISATGSDASAASQADGNSPPDVSAPLATIDNVFATGAVTFRFDDGWVSQYDTALPMLDAAGIKGTFYIVTRQLRDDGYTGFVSESEVVDMASRGQDVGAHTQTHPHLPTISPNAQQSEIAGSKEDLIAMGITPTTFSYPYGEYTPTTESIVESVGFSGAVTTQETVVTSNSDPFQIESPSIRASDLPEEIENMIDRALSERKWLVMTFHRIDESADEYSITPENFQKVVDYVKNNDIPTVTVAQGLANLSR